MSAQRYTDSEARARMATGVCPECGQEAGRHLNSTAFWLPRTCSLLPRGVTERIEQYVSDVTP